MLNSGSSRGGAPMSFGYTIAGFHVSIVPEMLGAKDRDGGQICSTKYSKTPQDGAMQADTSTGTVSCVATTDVAS